MSISRQEEIISTLWIIAAVLAFSAGYTLWGWAFAIKAFLDFLCALAYGYKEAVSRKDRRQSK